MKQVINTRRAPEAIGIYSQAIKAGNTVYLSGQIPIDPETNQLLSGELKQQIQQVMENLNSVAEAAGGKLSQIVKLTIYLTNIDHYSLVNEVMKTYFEEPYPARTVICVASLPKNAEIEIDAILILSD